MPALTLLTVHRPWYCIAIALASCWITGCLVLLMHVCCSGSLQRLCGLRAAHGLMKLGLEGWWVACVTQAKRPQPVFLGNSHMWPTQRRECGWLVGFHILAHVEDRHEQWKKHSWRDSARVDAGRICFPGERVIFALPGAAIGCPGSLGQLGRPGLPLGVAGRPGVLSNRTSDRPQTDRPPARPREASRMPTMQT